MLRHVHLQLITAILLLAPAASAHASEPVPPVPPVEGPLNLDGTVLWDGLHDMSVTLTLKNGKWLSGTVVTHDREKIAIARRGDGSIVAVPKAQVQAVQVLGPGAVAEVSLPPRETLPPRESRPTDSGRRLHIGGGTMVGLGAPLSLVGIGLSPTLGVIIGLPTLITGIGLIIGGSVMMKVAKRRNAAFHKAWGISKLHVSPILNVGREGGQLGVAMRF